MDSMAFSGREERKYEKYTLLAPSDEKGLLYYDYELVIFSFVSSAFTGVKAST